MNIQQSRNCGDKIITKISFICLKNIWSRVGDRHVKQQCGMAKLSTEVKAMLKGQGNIEKKIISSTLGIYGGWVEHELHFMKCRKGRKGISGKETTHVKSRSCKCIYGVRIKLRNQVHLEFELCGVMGMARDDSVRVSLKQIT